MTPGRIHSINVSDGGVPKHPRRSAFISPEGCEGDRQRNLQSHGGPDRAVCIFSLELIEDLRSEGHPIAPGTIGENLTIEGVDWSAMAPGILLHIGGVTLEITKPAFPCRHIAPSFADGDSTRVSEKVYPGWSRWYCRVLAEGTVSIDDPVEVAPGPQPQLFD